MEFPLLLSVGIVAGFACLLRFLSDGSRLSRSSGLPRPICKRALAGCERSCESVGLALFKKGKAHEAKEFLTRCIDTDRPEAMRAMILIDLRGHKFKQHHVRGLMLRLKVLDRTLYDEVRCQVFPRFDVGHLRAIYASDSDDLACAYHLGSKLKSTTNQKEAIELLQAALVEFPEAHLLLAKIYSGDSLGHRDIKKALRHFSAAIKEEVQDSQATYVEFLEALTPVEVIDCGLPEERETLAKTIGADTVSSSQDMWASLSKTFGHSISNLARKGQGVTYEAALTSVLKSRKIKAPKGSSILSREDLLMESRFKEIMRDLPEEDRKQFLDKVKAKLEEGKLGYGTLGALSASSLAIGASGFTPYLMATTTMSVLSGTAGVTLPFAAYATLTTTISVLTGPVGWAALAGGLAYTAGKPDREKTLLGVLGVMAIAAIRQRLLDEPV